MKHIALIALALMSLIAAGCDRSVAYNEWRRIDDAGWRSGDKLTYSYDVDDTASTFMCCIDIRNSDAYPYSNIYFSVKTIYPDGSVAVDTNIEFVLAEKDGAWRGRRNGKYVDGRYPFCYFHFPQQGQYRFEIGHAMRDTALQGIKEIGLGILKVEN